MKAPYDFKREWEKTKKQFIHLSSEAADMAKKGEKELIAISKKGKVQLDVAAMALKREKLYYLIGKEYAKGRSPANPSDKVLKLVAEVKTLVKEQRRIEKQLHEKTA